MTLEDTTAAALPKTNAAAKPINILASENHTGFHSSPRPIMPKSVFATLTGDAKMSSLFIFKAKASQITIQKAMADIL